MVVLCGRLVAAAFGLNLDRSVPWTEETDGVRFLVLPHPSGAVAIKEIGHLRHCDVCCVLWGGVLTGCDVLRHFVHFDYDAFISGENAIGSH